MNQKFNAPRGTADILPDAVIWWQKAESQARQILNHYGYQEIRTPYFEETDLFVRSVGEASDIVQKQMLNLAQQGPEDARDIKSAKLSLRPEGTASVVRSYIQNNFDKKEGLSKLFYIGPMFRGERPQKGRLRQFHQIGVEAIGPDTQSPYLDAEIMALSLDILSRLGVKDFQLKINTLGSRQDKLNFSKHLRKLFETRLKELCPDCQNRFQRNVFRILDCKHRDCRKTVGELDIGYDHLSAESRDYFQQVKEALRLLKIEFAEDPRMVRGLDYYTHTVFEISSTALGSQDALGAGGRYNHLVSQLGGPEADAVGFALGMERILLAGQTRDAPENEALDFYLIPLDQRSLAKCFQLLDVLRKQDMAGDMNYKIASMKSQMRIANRKGVRFAAIMGEEEEQKGLVTLKDMRTGNQQQVAISDFNSALFSKLFDQTPSSKGI